MRTRWTYLLATTLALIGARAEAQNCPRGMVTMSGPASYVASPGVQALNLTHGFTIECWAQVNGLNPNSGIIVKGRGSFSAYGIFLGPDSEYLGVIRRIKPDSAIMSPMDSFYNWHHIALVFRPGDSLYLYVDTLEVASTNAKNITVLDSSTDSIRIGMNADSNWFWGSIDEVRIWDAPRSLATIRANMFTVVPGSDPNLALYYTFDDGPGLNRVHDFSGHGRDGFLRGPSVDLLNSTSPMRNTAPGWQLAAREQRIVIPTVRCMGSFDTVIHVHNIGPRPDTVTSYTFSTQGAFSSVSNFPIPLPNDSSYYVPIDLHFEPGASGYFDDTLSIIGNNGCGGQINVAIHAAYDSVGLSFAPSVLNFDSILSCDPIPIRTVTVKNVSLTDSVTLVKPVIPPGSGLVLLTTFPRKLGPGQTMIDSFTLVPGVRGPVSLQAGIQLDKCSRIAQLTVTGYRQQPELSMPAVIDFGAVPADLASITRDTMIVVTNTGNTMTAIQSVTASDPMLMVLDGRTNIFRAPGDTLQLHLRLHPTSCGHLTAQLHVKGVLCATDTMVTVSIDVVPPLPLVMSSVDVGRICPNGSDTLQTTITNPNDRPIRLDGIAFSINTVFFNPLSIFPSLIPAHGSTAVEFMFEPALDGDYVDTAYLQMAPCGTGIAVLRGSRGYNSLAFDSTVLSFGRGCDTAPVTRTVTLTNRSARAVTITDTAHYGSRRFAVAPFALPFTLAQGESKRFTATFSPLLDQLDTGSFAFIGAEGCLAVRLPMRGSREIARAQWSPASLNFDTVCYGSSKALTVRLTNLGIDTIDIQNAMFIGAGFSFDSAINKIGGSGMFTIRFNSTVPGPHFGSLMLVADNCGTQFTLPLQAVVGAEPAIVISDTVLDFGSVPVGGDTVLCVTLTNPSCAPIKLSLDTSATPGFLTSQLPPTLAKGDTARLCIAFHPLSYSAAKQTLWIRSDSAPPRSIVLKGVGLAPDVHLKEHILDFGYVLHGSASTMHVHLSNVGNDIASITTSNSRQEYKAGILKPVAPSATDSIPVTFTPKQSTGLLLDTFLVLWSTHVDTVFLRGQGTDSGLILNAHMLDFGDVHVADSLSLLIDVTATEGMPTVKSVTFTPLSSLRFSDSAAVPYTITSDHDTLMLRFTYHPILEVRDTALIIIADDSARLDTIILTGRGVEAHVQINPIRTDFDTVVLGNSVLLPQAISIKNIGGYRLYVDSVHVGPDFIVALNQPTVAIAPDSPRYYSVTFVPQRARHLIDTILFFTSSPDSITPLVFTGTGVYPAGTGPSFGYTVAATQTRPGERDTIPVSLFGTRIWKIDADSLTLKVSFDPSMVLMHGAVAGVASLSKPIMHKLTDSTVEFSVAMDSFDVSPVFSLDAEALLGPNPTSYIHLLQSNPAADQPESATDGLFQVADCGGAVHGVVFAGTYKVTRVAPNPTSNDLTIAYNLGLDGPVALDLFDPLGRIAKHIDWSTQKQGSHTASLDLSSLPAGRYVYRLQSLEYHEDGAVLILR